MPRLDIIFTIQRNMEVLHIVKKIPMVFHNGSNYGYHFTRKELAEEHKEHLLV